MRKKNVSTSVITSVITAEVTALTVVSTPAAMLLALLLSRSWTDCRNVSTWSLVTKSLPWTQSCSFCSPSLALVAMSPDCDDTDGAIVSPMVTSTARLPTRTAAAASAGGNLSRRSSNRAGPSSTVVRISASTSGSRIDHEYCTTSPSSTAAAAISSSRRLHDAVHRSPAPIISSRLGSACGWIAGRGPCAGLGSRSGLRRNRSENGTGTSGGIGVVGRGPGVQTGAAPSVGSRWADRRSSCLDDEPLSSQRGFHRPADETPTKRHGRRRPHRVSGGAVGWSGQSDRRSPVSVSNTCTLCGSVVT